MKPHAKRRTVDIVGTPSAESDGDFHLIVTREQFESVAGREPTADERIRKGWYSLYPRDMAALFRSVRKVRVRLIVQPA